MLDSKDKEYKSDVLQLLSRKIRYLKEIFTITKETVFTKEDYEQNALNYISMIDRRENIIYELKVIDENISHHKYNKIFEDKEFILEVNKLKEVIKDIVKQIISIDESFENTKNEIMNNFKDKLKQINISKNINKAISKQSDYMVNDGTYYDSKNE